MLLLYLIYKINGIGLFSMLLCYSLCHFLPFIVEVSKFYWVTGLWKQTSMNRCMIPFRLTLTSPIQINYQGKEIKGVLFAVYRTEIFFNVAWGAEISWQVGEFDATRKASNEIFIWLRATLSDFCRIFNYGSVSIKHRTCNWENNLKLFRKLCFSSLTKSIFCTVSYDHYDLSSNGKIGVQ